MADVHGDVSLERADVLVSLATQRSFLRQTVKGLDDAQIALRPTVSDLCLGGILKHVASVEKGWVDFMLHGPEAIGPMDEAAREHHAAGFRLTRDDTLASLLATYEEVAASTEEAVRSIASRDDSHPLPESPWFPKGTRWSARRVLLHVVAETAHHCGHADIIREAIDGSKTMG